MIMKKLIENNVIKLNYENFLTKYKLNSGSEQKDLNDEELYEHFIINTFNYSKPLGCLPPNISDIKEYYLDGINIFEVIDYVNINERMYKFENITEEDDKENDDNSKEIFSHSEPDEKHECEIKSRKNNKSNKISNKNKKDGNNIKSNMYRRFYRFLLYDGKRFIYAYEQEYNEIFTYLESNKYIYPKIILYNKPLIRRGAILLKKNQVTILFKGCIVSCNDTEDNEIEDSPIISERNNINSGVHQNIHDDLYTTRNTYDNKNMTDDSHNLIRKFYYADKCREKEEYETSYENTNSCGVLSNPNRSNECYSRSNMHNNNNYSINEYTKRNYKYDQNHVNKNTEYYYNKNKICYITSMSNNNNNNNNEYTGNNYNNNNKGNHYSSHNSHNNHVYDAHNSKNYIGSNRYYTDKASYNYYNNHYKNKQHYIDPPRNNYYTHRINDDDYSKENYLNNFECKNHKSYKEPFRNYSNDHPRNSYNKNKYNIFNENKRNSSNKSKRNSSNKNKRNSSNKNNRNSSKEYFKSNSNKFDSAYDNTHHDNNTRVNHHSDFSRKNNNCSYGNNDNNYHNETYLKNHFSNEVRHNAGYQRLSDNLENTNRMHYENKNNYYSTYGHSDYNVNYNNKNNRNIPLRNLNEKNNHIPSNNYYTENYLPEKEGNRNILTNQINNYSINSVNNNFEQINPSTCNYNGENVFPYNKEDDKNKFVEMQNIEEEYHNDNQERARKNSNNSKKLIDLTEGFFSSEFFHKSYECNDVNKNSDIIILDD
ncbi:conserved Plasmodium protein, unknown function [Plasmodium sp. DRC-Itaito]|nr:conserved Plasmodium protein, unknown function [Plasmodium sp. DRC-Itaito]